MQQQADPSWEAYPHTILEFHGAQTVRIDLRQSVTEADGAALSTIGLGQPFAVITAYNPAGKTADESANRRRTEALRQRLSDRGGLIIPTQGVSPDGGHREPGFAVVLPREEAIAIATEFDQSAIFWWDGTKFWIHPALVSDSPRPLPEAAGGGT
jgi:hypothetical protein